MRRLEDISAHLRQRSRMVLFEAPKNAEIRILAAVECQKLMKGLVVVAKRALLLVGLMVQCICCEGTRVSRLWYFSSEGKCFPV